MKKRFIYTLGILALGSISLSTYAFMHAPNEGDAAPTEAKEASALSSHCHVYGEIKVVDYGEDYKVKVVDYGEDLEVKTVDYGEEHEGRWKFVDYGEDYKIKFVDYGEDFTIKYVDYGEGC